jgi:hypothetical protein
VENPDKPGQWKMRSEERKEAVRIGRRIVQWVVGIDELDEQALQSLRDGWANRLIPAQTEEIQDEWWSKILHERDRIENWLQMQSITEE